MALLNSRAVSDLLFLDKRQEALEPCGAPSSLGSQPHCPQGRTGCGFPHDHQPFLTGGCVYVMYECVCMCVCSV